MATSSGMTTASDQGCNAASHNDIQPAAQGTGKRIVKVRVDPQRCQGHTLCAMIAADMFTLSDLDGTSSAVCDVVPPDQEELVREAARSCPEQAILVEETKTGSSQVTIDHQKTRETMS